MAVDGAGNVAIGGVLLGSVDLGLGQITATGNYGSVLAAELDCTGRPLWNHVFGTAQNGSDATNGLAVDGTGAVLLTGQFSDTIDFGCGVLTSQAADGFVARLDGAGNCLWSKRFGGAFSGDAGLAIAADAAGNVLVAGTFSGTTDFGGGSVTSSGSQPALFLLKLDAAGSFVWVKQFGAAGPSASMTLDASANVLLCGSGGDLDFGGGVVSGGPLFLAKLDASGNFVWGNALGTPVGSTMTCTGIAAGAQGDFVIGGSYSAATDLGVGPLPASQGAGSVGGYVARFKSTGTIAFSVGNAGSGTTTVPAVALDALGNTFVTGAFDTALSFGGPTRVSAGGQDVFVVQLSPTGAFTSSSTFGDTSAQFGSGVAVTPLGAPVIVGGYLGVLDFGNGALTTVTPSSPFVARL